STGSGHAVASSTSGRGAAREDHPGAPRADLRALRTRWWVIEVARMAGLAADRVAPTAERHSGRRGRLVARDLDHHPPGPCARGRPRPSRYRPAGSAELVRRRLVSGKPDGPLPLLQPRLEHVPTPAEQLLPGLPFEGPEQGPVVVVVLLDDLE